MKFWALSVIYGALPGDMERAVKHWGIEGFIQRN
jgi:hypothetical protein